MTTLHIIFPSKYTLSPTEEQIKKIIRGENRSSFAANARVLTKNVRNRKEARALATKIRTTLTIKNLKFRMENEHIVGH